MCHQMQGTGSGRALDRELSPTLLAPCLRPCFLPFYIQVSSFTAAVRVSAVDRGHDLGRVGRGGTVQLSRIRVCGVERGHDLRRELLQAL